MDAQVQAKLVELAPYGTAWTVAFFVARFVLFPRRSADFGNRVVSIVHALAAIALAVPALDWAAPMATVGQRNTAAQTRCMEVSLAYFTYDLLCCLFIALDPVSLAHRVRAAQTRCMEVSLPTYDQLKRLIILLDPVSLAHHVCTIAGLAVGVFQGKCGTELVGCLMLMEVSNPSMHLNQLLKELGKSSSTLATANQALFALLFLICRLLVGPFVVHATVMSPTTPAVVKAGGVGILLVSLVWFHTIASIALYKMGKGSKAKGSKKAK